MRNNKLFFMDHIHTHDFSGGWICSAMYFTAVMLTMLFGYLSWWIYGIVNPLMVDATIS